MRAEPANEPELRPTDLVQSVSRAMRVLEVVSRQPRIPVKSIARRCGLNLSTAYHLVRTLAYEGYLVRLPDGRYVVGEQVAQRYLDLVARLERPPRAEVVLRALTDRAGVSCYLGVLRDDRVTVVGMAEAPGSPYLEDFELGLDVAAHATALGKALLLAMPPRQRRRYLTAHEMRRFTSRTRTEPADLERELAAVPAGALVSEHGEFRDGVSCAAALVPRNSTDAPAWAVVVAVADEEVPTSIAAEVKLAARDLCATGTAGDG